MSGEIVGGRSFSLVLVSGRSPGALGGNGLSSCCSETRETGSSPSERKNSASSIFVNLSYNY